MKTRSLALLFAAAVSAPVVAQNVPAQVTDADITKYKSSSEAECRAGAAGKGDPKDIAVFCGCLFASLESSMTRAEWQQAYLHTSKNEPDRVREILGPHLQRSECQPGAAAAPATGAGKLQDGAAGAQPKARTQGLKPPK